jgi:hypothetical protein
MIIKDTRFGRLIVKEEVPKPSNKKTKGKYYRCECECGNKDFIALESSLKNNNTSSCGCYRKEQSAQRVSQNFLKGIENGHTPGRKRWLTNKEGETHTLTEWANILGITKQALSLRLKKYSVEKALDMKGENKNGT